MTCRELAGFLDDYVAGTLDAAQGATFAAHLAACPDCRAYLRGYADTMRLAKDAYADEPIPPAVPERLVHAILAARDRRNDR
jgi:anti-sigma factor RsiW